MVRPHDDLRGHDEVPDPQETIHFLRQSNEQWQATAERLARQRDYYYGAVNDLDAVLYASGMDDRDAVAAAIDILDVVLDR